MLDPAVNAGLDAGPIQKTCGAGSVPGPDFGENLTSLTRPNDPLGCSETNGTYLPDLNPRSDSDLSRPGQTRMIAFSDGNVFNK